MKLTLGAMRESRKILGTPFFLFALPLILAAWGENRDRWENPVTPEGVRDQAQDSWQAMDYCLSEHRDRMHTFVLFRDDDVVESECNYCLAVREREDRGLGQ